MPGRKSDIWIIRADGSDAHRIKPNDIPDSLIYPSWYPDDKSVAVMDDDTNTTCRLDLVHKTTVKLTDPARMFAGRPGVAPDGSAVAFAG